MFFRFPIELKFAGVMLGEPDPDQIGPRDQILETIESGRQRKIDNLKLPILLLNHGAAHNLLRDHGLDTSCFRLIDDTGGDRGPAFVKAAGTEPAMVIADELTCLDVVGATPEGRPVSLLKHRLVSAQSTQGRSSAAGPYFSVAVRSSAPNWVQFFEQAFPLSLQTYRDSIAEEHAALYAELKKWTTARIKPLGLSDVEAEKSVTLWCRSVLMLDRPGELAPEWDPILARARELVDSAGRSTHA